MKAKFLLPLALVGLSLSACQDEDFGYSGKDIAYQKNFMAQFPNIDPNHNWCTVDTRSLQVVTSQPSDIRVYDESGTQLLAHYYDVNGTENIIFDLELNARRVLVTDGNSVLKVGLDEVANFSVTRAATEANNPDEGVIDYNAGPCPYYFFFEDLGATADFDFNDIVLKVEYTPSNVESEAKVSLMAAGGTLPITVNYVPSGVLDATFSGELFDKKEFGVTTDIPVNVKATKGVDGKTPIEKEIEVPAYYSVARHLASFVVNVEDRSISATPHSTLPEDNTPRVIVFRKHDTDWSNESNAGWTCTWPDEGVNITNVYTQFDAWVANHKDANWPNFMSDGDDAVVYDTPYFYVKANKLTLAAAQWQNKNGNLSIIKEAETSTVQIIPKRGYLDSNYDQTVTAFLAGVETTDPEARTSLATLSEPSSEEPYTYNITANEDGLKGVFYLNVMLSGTDYTRPLSAALKFDVTYEGTIIIRDEGDIEPGIDYTLGLVQTNKNEEGTNVTTDQHFDKNQKYVTFYFDKYQFKLDGIAPEDYKNYEVLIWVDSNKAQFMAYSYQHDKETNIWTINGFIEPAANTFTIPMDVFYNNVIETELNKVVVARADNGESKLGTDYYHFIIREKAAN